MRRFSQIGLKSAGIIFALDIAGTFLFAVEGAVVGADAGLDVFGILVMSFSVALMGTLTGVGGGTLRDILLARVPIILRADVYATAALAGAVAMIVARKLGIPPLLAALAGGLTCFIIRMIAVWQHWALPHLPGNA